MYIRGGDNQITALLGLPIGERTDRLLYLLLEPWFLGYWTFSRPKDRGIEIADVLTWYDDVVLLFEAKTRSTGRSDIKWAAARIHDAIETLNERAGMLRRGEVAGFRNKWRGEVEWTPTTVKDYYGVVILNHLSDPFEPREVAPEAFQKSEIPIQVFSLADFVELLRLVNTIYDFIVYYELRSAFAGSFGVPVHLEADTYHEVVRRMPDLAPGHLPTHKMKESRQFQMSLTRAMASSDDARKMDFVRVAASYLLDTSLNSTIEKATPDTSGKRVGGSSHEALVKGMSTIAEMTRIRRSVWGRRWVEAAEVAVRSGTGRHTNGHSPTRNRSYVVSAMKATGVEREAAMSNQLREAMESHGTTSALGIAANPEKLLWTFDAYRRWLRGVGDDELAPERVMDPTVAFAERN